ncbi:MAG: hypothetical protein SCARUB_04509, partial [Candidatus Scalindua rubra]
NVNKNRTDRLRDAIQRKRVQKGRSKNLTS